MSGEQPTTPPLACQLDVAVLDDYLHSLLLTKFLASLDPLLKQFSNDEHDARRIVRMVLSALLPAATLWFTQAQTPATKALGLRAVMTSNESSVQATKWKYIAWTAIIPLLYQLLQRYVIKLQEELREEEPLSSEVEEDIAEQRKVARERQYAVAQGILRMVKLGLPLCKLGLLLSMLWKHKDQNRAPRLSMVLAGLGFLTANSSGASSSLAESSAQVWPPKLYVLYAHRRWLYEESVQTLKIVFSPLLSSLHEGRQFVESVLETLLQKLTSMWLASNTRQITTSPAETACSICGKDPIAIPYETDSCDHIFCYTCLWRLSCRNRVPSRSNSSSASSGSGYPCPSCRRIIRCSRPVPAHRYESRKQNVASSNQGDAVSESKLPRD